MFTVWGPTKQSCNKVFFFWRGVDMWSIHRGSFKAWEEGRHCFSPSIHTHTHSHTLIHTHTLTQPIFLSLDVNVTSCSSGTFACVAVSGGEVCLFCVTEGKGKTAPCVVCCVIWSLALTVTNIRPPPRPPSLWLVSDRAACSLCQAIHEPGNMSRIQPRVLS